MKPVYGTLNQAKTWNPILINYKYLWHLMKDAWRTKKLIDKSGLQVESVILLQDAADKVAEILS